MNTTTNVSGEYILDLINLPSGYTNKDVLLVQAYINEPPEKYANAVLTCDTGVDFQTQNLTLKVVVPRTNVRSDLSDKEILRRMFAPHADAIRIIPVDDDGTTYQFLAKRHGNTAWKLVLPDGTQIGSIDSSGNLKIAGEVSVLQNF